MRCLWSPILSSVSRARWYSNPAPRVLRSYQESCLEACLDALSKGSTRIAVSLPTGSGKTTVFISLLSRLLPPQQAPRSTQALIIVNSVELAEQTAQQTRYLFPGWSVEIEQGKRRASGNADVTVATYQTLLRSGRLVRFDPQCFKAVIVDEAHHAAAPSYRRILSHFHNSIQNPDKGSQPPVIPHRVPILGFSATLSRHDGLALGSIFEEIVYHRDFLDMIREQWLCNVRFTTVHAKIDFSGVTVNSITGDFNPTSLSHVINTDTVNQLIVRTWLDKASERKSTLVFCVNLSHVANVTAAFRNAGVDARYIHSGTPAAERRMLVEGFRAGEYPVLVNCAVLTEGADIPNIDCVIVARPTKSRNVYAQMIGRGMRLSPSTGKVDCRIIDFSDSSQDRLAGVISMPSLLGLDPNELSDDETIEGLRELVAAKPEFEDEVDYEEGDEVQSGTTNVPLPKSVTYVDHDDPFTFVDRCSGDPILRKLSHNAWVSCGGGVYVLQCLDKGFIDIKPVDDENVGDVKFQAYYTPRTMGGRTAAILKISPYRRKKKILTAASLADAIRGCDTYAHKEVLPGPLARGLSRTANWRWIPATEDQKKLIVSRFKARKGVKGQAETVERETQELTRGEAANIIARLKHGALARYEKKKREEARLVLAAEKEERRRAREHVKVGRLVA